MKLVVATPNFNCPQSRWGSEIEHVQNPVTLHLIAIVVKSKTPMMRLPITLWVLVVLLGYCANAAVIKVRHWDAAYASYGPPKINANRGDLLRFVVTDCSSQDVFLMNSKNAYEDCDFYGPKIGGVEASTTCKATSVHDKFFKTYKITEVAGSTLYFASSEGFGKTQRDCSIGQKVQVNVT